jgi:flagellar motor protein MotB
MCKPNKSLRMTVRAFIKAEEKKKAAAAEAAAAAAIEEENAAAQQEEQPTDEPQAESDVQTEAAVEQPQEENVDAADATEGALAPEATDPLAQVEEVRLCQIYGHHDVLTCIYRSPNIQLEKTLWNWTRPNNRLDLGKKLLPSQLKRLTLRALMLSKRPKQKVNNMTRTDRMLRTKTFRTWTGTLLTGSTQ